MIENEIFYIIKYLLHNISTNHKNLRNNNYILYIISHCRKHISNMKTFIIIFSFFTMISFYSTPEHNKSFEILDGYELIDTMHSKYYGKWFEKLYIKQKVIFYKNGVMERDEVWTEYIELPGKVRSNIGNIEEGNCEIVKNDTQFVFRNSKLNSKRRAIHSVLLLGFDVYLQNPDKTYEQLKESDFNLEKLYETKWQNKKVYVVGSTEGDTTSNQFWIDKKHFYLVRLIQKTQTGKLLEVEFTNIKKLGNGWIATELIFKLNGKLAFIEEYLDYRIPERIDPENFNVDDFKTNF